LCRPLCFRQRQIVQPWAAPWPDGNRSPVTDGGDN
jgi:hypothetical protein